MNEQRRMAARRLADLLERENGLLDRQDYDQVKLLLSAKQQALKALEDSPAIPAEPDTDADADLARSLALLAEQNRRGLQQALQVQDRIMGIVADAARRMLETPLYGGHGGMAVRKSSPAVAVIVRA